MKKFITGILEKNQKGFGFVRQDEEPDIFIRKDKINNAMDKDLVEVKIIDDFSTGKKPEGIVTKVLQRNTKEVVGVFQRSKSFGFVVPINQKDKDIFISKKFTSGARDGDTVVASIISYPTSNKKCEGKITEIIARKNQPGGEIISLARSKGARETFPSKASAQAKAIRKMEIEEEEINRRVDLRHKNIVTIDGAHSKDLDDGVSIEKLDNGNYLLGVHIADVSHYVREESPLDVEALKRGNSIYLINTVIPMLPKELSNGICSLNEGEDRLTLSCEMEFDKEGTLVKHNIFESIINSKARLIYDDVSYILDNRKEGQQPLDKLTEDLYLMGEIADVLRKRREEEGSLDFDIDESEIELDEQGVPIDIDLAYRGSANKLIEDFMLAANKCVAEHFYWLEVPFVYRVHDKPKVEKILELKAFLSRFGINLSGNPDNIHPKVLSRILEDVKDKPYEKIVATVMLRTMSKAEYLPFCNGHFGLGFSYYCHFTSPIRRYPDLMIHRIIKAYLNGENLDRFESKVEEASKQCSLTERSALELERDVEKMKKAEYMEEHIGECYMGIVSGVTSFGIFVELYNTVEGLVHFSTMTDDMYRYEPEEYRVVGQDFGKVYALGDEVCIMVKNASGKERFIDFELIDEDDVIWYE